MTSFQQKLAAGLRSRGVEVCYRLEDQPYQAVLVVGGTRRLGALWRVSRQGVPVIQRLDGMNWIHRRRWTGLRHFLRAEYGNVILALIRSRLADRIVYQSEFSRQWWERAQGITRAPFSVVYNGLDLSQYTPSGTQDRPEGRYRMLLVEGSLAGGYETGLEVAVRLAQELSRRLKSGIDGNQSLELMIVGKVAERIRQTAARIASENQSSPLSLKWMGIVDREEIPRIDRSAHVLFSADINAACPNTVVEAFACGLPVAAFDTGALPEMVTGDAGKIVPYGGDPWRLDAPDTPALARAVEEILQDQPRFRQAARALAEERYSLEQMVNGYWEALFG